MLTDKVCRSAKPGEKPYKLWDAHGLHLFVSKTGFKSWRWKYRLGGTTEKLLVLGPYPQVTLLEARVLRLQADAIRRTGADPAAHPTFKKAAPSVTPASPAPVKYSLKAAAKDWVKLHKAIWSKKHMTNVERWLRNDCHEATSASEPPLWEGQFGGLELTSITARMVHDVLGQIEARGAVDQAHRMRQRLSGIFATAIAAGFAEKDPATPVAGALTKRRNRHYPAIVSLTEARRLLQQVENEPGYPLIKLANRVMALTAVRSGALRHAEWDELEGLDGDSPMWRIPAAKMKLGLQEKDDEVFDFVVPLARQTVDAFKVARRLSGSSTWIFPGPRFAMRPISDSTLSARYRNLPEFSGRHVPHGWRTTFSTIMNERAAVSDQRGDREIIDMMLAHIQEGVEPIYNRAAYMPRRREIAQEWADLLLEEMAPAEQLLESFVHR